MVEIYMLELWQKTRNQTVNIVGNTCFYIEIPWKLGNYSQSSNQQLNDQKPHLDFEFRIVVEILNVACCNQLEIRNESRIK